MNKCKYAKTAAAFLAAVLAAGALAGCSSKSSSEDESSTASSGAENGTGETLGSPSGSDNDSAAANQYELSNINMFDIDFASYVDVSTWKDAVVTKEDVTESDYAIQYANAYNLQYTYGLATEEITDRPVQAGDTLTIDFTGYVDGEELENGSGTDQSLTIGSGRFISGFEEGLVGAEAGDTVTLELAFPDPYTNNPDLSGVPVTFDVTVKAIQGFNEVSDEAISEASNGAYATYDEYYEDFTTSRAKDYRELTIWQKVMEQVVEKDICQELVDDFINTYLYSFNAMAVQYGMDMETLLYYYYGYTTVEDFEQALMPTAQDYALQSCAVLAIADLEGIEIPEEDIDAEYNSLLQSYDSEEDMLADGTTREGIKFDLLLDTVEQYIYDTIEIQE